MKSAGAEATHLDTPYPVLGGVDLTAPDPTSASRLLMLASFCAALVDQAEGSVDEDVRVRARGLARVALSRATEAKLERTAWVDAVWKGREVFELGPEEERLALLAAAEFVLLGERPREVGNDLAAGLLRHHPGPLTESFLARFAELKSQASALDGLEAISGLVRAYILLDSLDAPFVIAYENGAERASPGTGRLWERLLPPLVRAGVA